MATSAQEQTVVSLPGMRRRVPTRLRSGDTLTPSEGASTRGGALRCANPGFEWRGEDLVANEVHVHKRAALLHRGAPFTALYIVRSGSCKSTNTTPDGHEQIAAFHIAGEIIGVESIGDGAYGATITALENSEFHVMPYDRVRALAQENDDFQRTLCATLSREIRRGRTLALWLATMRAEQRLASFLLDLADRYGARGHSSREFVLPMSRQDIGVHLGLSHETVSRLLSNFHRQSLLSVQGRLLTIVDQEALQAL